MSARELFFLLYITLFVTPVTKSHLRIIKYHELQYSTIQSESFLPEEETQALTKCKMDIFAFGSLFENFM